VVLANPFKATQSPAAKKKLAKSHVTKQQRENGGTGSAAEVEQLVAAWDMANSNSLPCDERWGIIKKRARRSYCGA